ncbi:efflux RND transporter periplasmic adaptor subunit [bacterium]|nr:efflux RND transporter periplasmic adaptor subunit [bacterium]MBU1063811.1 efflux RND transporter periplasmic adaptor subunit [bacterium]MBU1635733.1 efflux RND transporter periplasmic adaptor subunit [bacterium]MBU1872621.1 efflux RND transporter periplasmic adaptor subunit [bacterium]
MKKKNIRKIIILVLVVIVVGVVVVANKNKSKVKPIEVQTEKVKKERIVQTVNASGSLIPKTQVKISANVAARITNITVALGDRVKAGDLLVELDKAQYEAAYERALSVVQSNKANQKKVSSELKRVRQLYKSNLTSEADLEAGIAQTEIAESQVAQAEAALRQAKDDLDKTRILSPMNGIVTSIRKEVGEIALGSVFQEDVILVVSDMSKMEVRAEVDETDVVSVSVGDTALIEVDALPDTTYKGIVSEIAHSASTTGLGTQEQITNFEIEISVLGQDLRFRPGMSATVDVITDVRDSAVVVPIQSLTVRMPEPVDNTESDSTNTEKKPPAAANNPAKVSPVDIVFVVHPINEAQEVKKGPFAPKQYPTAEQREIKVGISSDTKFEIISGLDVGEEIIIGSYKAISKDLKHDSALKISSGENEKKGKKK